MPIKIVAAENFYGDIAKQIGGPYVEVTNILNNPNQDPHVFSADIKMAKAIANAQIIIYNGISYDPWMEKLLSVRPTNTQMVINVADLTHHLPGDNPHIWYNLKTAPLLISRLTHLYSQLDPEHTADYQRQAESFNNQFQKIIKLTNHIKQDDQGTSILATEPVFNYLASALGLTVRDTEFQIAVMNETEPSASSTQQFIDLLQNHQVKCLIYNKQVFNITTENMKNIAQKNNIPLVGVTETLPNGLHYTDWMFKQLLKLHHALQLSTAENNKSAKI